jgi:hypothetical protein
LPVKKLGLFENPVGSLLTCGSTETEVSEQLCFKIFTTKAEWPSEEGARARASPPKAGLQ